MPARPPRGQTPAAASRRCTWQQTWATAVRHRHWQLPGRLWKPARPKATLPSCWLCPRFGLTRLHWPLYRCLAGCPAAMLCVVGQLHPGMAVLPNSIAWCRSDPMTRPRVVVDCAQAFRQASEVIGPAVHGQHEHQACLAVQQTGVKTLKGSSLEYEWLSCKAATVQSITRAAIHDGC